jgi:hypothetical protein
MVDVIEKPTTEQVNEVVNPSLSQDSFKLGDKTFPLQILPISYEKKLALIIAPLLKKIGQFEGKNLFAIFKEGIEADIEEGFNIIIQFILTVCKKYDASITEEWISDHVCLADAFPIIMAQLEKNKLGNMVSNFFFQAAKLMPPQRNMQESQPNSGN